MSDRWITTAEYAAKYAVNRHTVKLWARQGKIRAVRTGNGFLVLDPNIFAIANPDNRIIRNEDLMPLLRPQDVAKLTGMPLRTLNEYAQKGKVGFKHVGRFRRYSINDVREIMAIRKFNKLRVSPEEKRITILEWAKMRLQQQNS